MYRMSDTYQTQCFDLLDKRIGNRTERSSSRWMFVKNNIDQWHTSLSTLLFVSQNSVISWNSILWFMLVAFAFACFIFLSYCVSHTDLELTLYTRLVLKSEIHCLPPGVPSSMFYLLFFFHLSLYVVCVCAVVEQFQLYILGFASNASLSFFFHHGIVLNSWFSNLRFVCAGIAGVHHHTMLYFDDISSFFSLVTCFCFITTY